MSQPFPPDIGPIAPERNPPINPQFYQPRVFFISAISLGATTIITTSVDHNYVIGQQIRLLIPVYYGAQQLNQQTAYVTVIPATNQVTIPINSSQFNAFIPSPIFGPTKPQIIAIGDINMGAINPNGRSQNATFIPGSFIDISPA